MRLIIDSLIAVMLAAILGGVLLYYRDQQRDAESVQAVQRSLARLHEQVLYHGALRESKDNLPFPTKISPLWFGGKLPTNMMVSARQPWMDVAPVGDMSDQPPDPIVTRPDQAGFWYNPNRGLVRARVAPGFSEQETLSSYNRLNASVLKTLSNEPLAARKPLPLPIVIANSEKLQKTPDVNPPVEPSNQPVGEDDRPTLKVPDGVLPVSD